MSGTEWLANGLERRRVPVVAVHIAQQSRQLVERRGIQPAVLLDAVARAGAELVDAPARLRHADDRHVEMAAFHHRLQRRKDLLEGQVARRPEEHQGIRTGVAHRELPPLPPGFSRCPPNWYRRADRTRS